jgi:hypothetical protein
MTDEEKRNRVKSANRYVDGSHILAFKGSRSITYSTTLTSGAIYTHMTPHGKNLEICLQQIHEHGLN